MPVKPRIQVFCRDVPYYADPTRVFEALCGENPATLLLDSAEINSKKNLKSLLLVDAAVRLECRENQVMLQALSDNGLRVLDILQQALASAELTAGVIQQRNAAQLTLHFVQDDTAQDEDSRLKSVSVFDSLRAILQGIESPAEHPEALFIGGLFSYDLAAQFEPMPTVQHDQRCPDFCFYIAETLLIMDHQHQRAHVQTSAFASCVHEQQRLANRLLTIYQQLQMLPTALPAPALTQSLLTVSHSDLQFCQTVEALKAHIQCGNIFQVVPSRRFSLPCPNPLSAYRELKQSNPSPYMFFMQDALFTLFGASPESALKFTATSRQVEIYPIAGTRPRGKTPSGTLDYDLDSRLELDLRLDKKELAEHMMLVDLARNDVARISEPGSRYVADLLHVDRYSHVMHLVSRVIGTLRYDLDALHAYQASMNMGTLTGAPKIRAMQLIYETEQRKRGSYGGAVGYMTGHGDLDTCIVIRSAYVENQIAHVQAGAGVVYDSIPQAEADETRTKAQAVLSAIIRAHNFQITESAAC
ncbi:MAG: anthranilate synthase component 1 [Plesiomonas sp.]